MDALTALLATTVMLMVPLMLAAVGEIIVERSGVLNLSIEGVMLAGSFVAALALSWNFGFIGAAAIALPFGVVAGLALSWLYISRQVSQIVGGILVNLLVLALTTVLYVKFLSTATAATTLGDADIPVLSDIPIIGEAFFSQPWLVYVAFLSIPLAQYLLFSTWFGLHCRASGERPEAVDSAGVSVNAIRTCALCLGCAFVALGGASLVLLQSGAFTPGITAGKGFIALAIVMVARWRPRLAVLTAAICGLAEAFQFQARTMGLGDVPSELWSMLPYLVTILAVLVGGSSRSPAALGHNYERVSH